MNNIQKEQLYDELLETYGQDLQEDVAIEEMSELTKAIIKMRRAKHSNNEEKRTAAYENLKEEIADVEIMLEQLILMHHISQEELDEIKDNKLKRQQERLRGKEEEK